MEANMKNLYRSIPGSGSKKKFKRLISIICAVIILITGISIIHYSGSNSSPFSDASGILKVHFIDVGQADCILIQSPAGKNMLIDAGNNGDGKKVVTYLKSQGVEKVDVLIGTHPHKDHIGGMDKVVKSFDIGSIYMPKVSTNTQTFEDLLKAINEKQLKVTTAKAGLNINFDSGIEAEMLAPNSTDYEDLNNYSAVIKLTFGNTSFLFAGDAENISEDEMLAKGYNLKADVLKVGHHGSSTSTSLPFLEAVAPKYAVISVGKDNDYNHPNAGTLSRLSDFGVKVYRTDKSGTIIITSDGTSISVSKKASSDNNGILSSGDTGSSTEPNASEAKSSQSDNKKVYYTPSGKSYHYSKDCSALAKSKTILEGTLDTALSSGHSDPCNICVH
jgi:competence protein ComEC